MKTYDFHVGQKVTWNRSPEGCPWGDVQTWNHQINRLLADRFGEMITITDIQGDHGDRLITFKQGLGLVTLSEFWIKPLNDAGNFTLDEISDSEN